MLLIPRSFVKTVNGSLTFPPLIQHIDPSTVEGELGKLGGSPVKIHDREAFVADDFALGVLYTTSWLDLDHDKLRDGSVVVGMCGGVPVERLTSSP